MTSRESGDYLTSRLMTFSAPLPQVTSRLVVFTAGGRVRPVDWSLRGCRFLALAEEPNGIPVKRQPSSGWRGQNEPVGPRRHQYTGRFSQAAHQRHQSTGELLGWGQARPVHRSEWGRGGRGGCRANSTTHSVGSTGAVRRRRSSRLLAIVPETPPTDAAADQELAESSAFQLEHPRLAACCDAASVGDCR